MIRFRFELLEIQLTRAFVTENFLIESFLHVGEVKELQIRVFILGNRSR